MIDLLTLKLAGGNSSGGGSSAAVLSRSSAPTGSTAGEVGQYCLVTGGNLYKCTSAANGVYTWVAQYTEADAQEY